MKKFKFALLSLVLVLSLLSSMAFAETKEELTSPKQAITSYLKAVQDRNVEAIMNQVIDHRYSTQEEQKHSYENMLRYKRNQIAETKIEQELSASNGDVTYVVEMTANDGSVESSPFTVKNVDGKWRVVVDAGKNLTKDPLYTLKKTATEKEDVKADVQLTPAPSDLNVASIQSQLMNDEFSDE